MYSSLHKQYALEEFELQYRAYYLAADARQTSIAIAVWMLPVLFFAYPDYLTFGASPKFAGLLVLRIVLCLFSFYTIFALLRTASSSDYDYLFLRWAACTSIVVLVFNYSWIPYAPATGVITILIIFSSYMVFPNKFRIRVMPPLTLSVGNLALEWWGQGPVSLHSFLITLAAIVMVNILGIIFSTLLQKHRRTEFKARLDEARIKAELSSLASIDDLTGIFNRRKLIQLATAEFEQFKSNNRQLSVLMIDIDHFKLFNDSYGHEVGDQILTKFASYVKANIHEKNIWGRLGGEEFVLIMPNLPIKEAQLIAERLHAGLKEDPTFQKNEMHAFTISIGIAELHENDQNFGDMLKRADQALYLAKREGRNRTAIIM